MDDFKTVTDFCINQKSIRAVMYNFIDQFMEYYKDEDEAEQEILTKCVLQMFRKYYYSALDPEMIYTPAKIVNILCKRQFGADLMVIPRLSVVSKGEKISRLQYDFIIFKVDNHLLVKDMEFFLQVAMAGIQMESPGIPLVKEYSKLKKNIFIFDRHYINIIALIALEAGYIECIKFEKGFIGKRTPKSEEFLCLDSEKKLRSLIDTAVALCSKMIIHAFPELQKEFTYMRVANFLQNPKSFELAMKSIFKRMGMDLKQLDRPVSIENLTDTLKSVGINEENVVKYYWFQNMLDIYFFTPFGYYLQLIQPIYPDIYDLAMELDEILSDIDDFQAVRNKLFSAAMEYDLTVLDENLLVVGKKLLRENVIRDNIRDEEMYHAVLSSIDYLKQEEEAAVSSEDDLNDFFQLMENLFTPQSVEKNRNAKIIEFPVKKGANVIDPMDVQVFIFKVKLFYAKRIWRQIEIKGTQTLHELHEVILDSFGLDSEHLYAFFMSNKFWDPKTEYAHPAAEGRSASKIEISNLHLSLKQKFAYIYDFGDEHRFEVELIATHDVVKKVKYPREIKRNKPIKTVCDECQSDQKPIEWYCNDHDSFLCDKCAHDKMHEGCFIVNAIL